MNKRSLARMKKKYEEDHNAEVEESYQLLKSGNYEKLNELCEWSRIRILMLSLLEEYDRREPTALIHKHAGDFYEYADYNIDHDSFLDEWHMCFKIVGKETIDLRILLNSPFFYITYSEEFTVTPPSGERPCLVEMEGLPC